MRLRFMHPAVGEVVFPVHPESVLVIGRRGGGAGVELNWDTRISRRHATITVTREGTILFRDLGSANGSYHGASRIEGEIELQVGTSILLGETVMLVSNLDEEPFDPWSSEATDHGEGPNQVASSDLVHVENLFDMDDFETKELQSPAVEIEILEPVKTPPPRTTARFVSADRVEVFFTGPDGFRTFWENELTNNNLFVVTNTPPRFGSQVTVFIETPDGSVELTGTVVHLLDTQRARRFEMLPGAGLRIDDLGLELRTALDNYAKGESASFGTELEYDTGDIQAHAKRVLAAYDAGDLYAALELEPTASESEIAARLGELETRFSSETSETGPEKARAAACMDALSKMGIVLGVQQRRLQYDFSHGHVRAEERLNLALSGEGPSLGELQRAWNFVFQERVERSAMLMREAFAAAQQQDYAQAIRHGTEALELNPFFQQLRTYIDQWRAAADL